MSKYFLYFLFDVLFFTSFYSNAQQSNFRHYDIKDGLAGLTVYSAVQDQNGFMWFATETGLSRFDGTRFKTYTKDDGLPDNEIIKLFVDSKNRVWILPFSNSICYFMDGKIHTQNEDIALKEIHFEFPPYSICEDSKGNIAITDELNIYIVGKDNFVNKISRIENQRITVGGSGLDLNGNFIFCISSFAEESLYRFENNALSKMFKLNTKTQNVRNMVLFFNGCLIFNKEKQFHLQIPSKNYDSIFNMPKHFSSLSKIDDSLFAINTSDTSFLFNINQKKIIKWFLVGSIVNTCFKDNEGSFWFGTNGYGLYKLSNSAFGNYNFREDKYDLPVYSVFKDEDIILVGTNESLLWSLDIIKQTLTKLRIFDRNLNSERINSILKYTETDYVIGTGNGPINLKRFKANLKEVIRNQAVKNIFKYSDTLLVATNGGVFRLPINNYPNFDTLWHSRATCAYKFDSTFYIGTLAGLFLVDKNKNIINAGQKESLLNSRISGMATDGKGNVWIATYGNGILGYRDGKVFKHITVKEGLTSNTCEVILVNNGIIWTGTDKGINKIDISKEKITTYSSIDGLNCDIINCLLVDNDTVYVGTPYGLTIFNSNEINKKSICNLIITAFVSDKNSSNTKLDNIEFAPGDKNFRIDYTAISFKSQGNIDYFYKLSDIDTNWRTTKQNNIQFNALPPGNYTLQLYAINAFGKNSGIKTINFSIEKYFYQQNWFLILFGATIIGVIWFFVQRRIDMIRKTENAKLLIQQRISELEQMALRAQMNPHFIFNCLNSIQQYIFEKDALEANKFIADFASLIRQTLDLSANKFVTLEQEIKYLNTYLQIEQSRFDNSFEFSIEAEKVLLQNEIFIPPLLLQPFVENSLRHGIRNLEDRKGRIEVQFKIMDKVLICTIKDNGIGREASHKLNLSGLKEYESKGLSITQRRVNEMNTFNEQRISIETEDVMEHGKVNGTLVTLRFTLG